MKPTDNIPLGIFIIVATVCAMAFTDAVIKFVSASFPLWQIFVVRSMLAITILLALVLAAGSNERGKINLFPRSMRWVLLRSFLLALMYVAIYAAVPKLPLAVIAAALYTGPIFTALFSAALIKEPVDTRGWCAVALGFAGVLVVLRPTAAAFSFYALIPVIAGMFYALAAVITRAKCTLETPQVLAIMLNFAVLTVGIIATAVIAFAQPIINPDAYPFLLGNWIRMGAFEWQVIALLAVLITVIGLGLAKAYQSAPPTVIATFDYAYLPFAALFGFLFFREVPDTATVTGILMIVVAGVAVSRKTAS